MKPRTQLERDLQLVIDRGKLRPLTRKQMEQAHTDMDKKPKWKVYYFVSTQRTDGIEISKYYKAHRIGRKDQFTYYQLCIIRAERDGHVAWASRPRLYGMYVDSFANNSDITIKSERIWYNAYTKDTVVLRSSAKDFNKYSVVINRYNNVYEFQDPRIESIIKCGYQVIVDYLIDNRKSLSAHLWTAFKVAHRHHFRLNSTDQVYKWLCLINMLRRYGKDYRNPHYICPKDLDEAYNKMIDEHDRQVRIETEKIERLKANKLIAEWSDKYVKEHKKYLGIVITGAGISITPLQSVNEFYEEGKAMHHCVFSNGYCMKKDTLILSAKDEEGNRLATIEYNLPKKMIMQCRARCNQVPPRKDEIENLIKTAI